MSDDDVTVRDNLEASRFEIRVGDELIGELRYQLSGTEYAIMHTGIEPAHGGRGMGATLVTRALDTIRERSGTVLPYCPFVPKVIRDHPEYADLVPAERRAQFGL